MTSQRNNAGPCFLVASDPAYHFGDYKPIREGLGAFVFELDDVSIVDSLLDLYYREAPDRAFELTALPKCDFNAADLVLASRELSRAESIGHNLDSEDYGTNNPTFAAIGRCAVRLADLAGELQHVLQKAATDAAPPTEQTSTSRELPQTSSDEKVGAMDSTDGSLSPRERVKAALTRLDTEADDATSKPHRFRHAVRAYLEALCDAPNGKSLLTEYGEFVQRKTAPETPYAITWTKGRRHVRPDATRILRRSSPQLTASSELRNESDAIATLLNNDSAWKADFYFDRVEPPDGVTRDEFRKAELERFLTDEAYKDLENWASAADDLASEAEGYLADDCLLLLQVQRNRYECFEMETAPTFADEIKVAARFLVEQLEARVKAEGTEPKEVQPSSATANPINLEALDARLNDLLRLPTDSASLPKLAAAVRGFVEDHASDRWGPRSVFREGWEEAWSGPNGVFENAWILSLAVLNREQKGALTSVCVEALRFLLSSDTPLRKEQHAAQLQKALREYLDVRGYDVSLPDLAPGTPTRLCQTTEAPSHPPPTYPSKKAWQAWFIHTRLGETNQTEIAEIMIQNGTPATQGQVSKWLKEVREYIAAGGKEPDPEKLDEMPESDARTILSVDPALLDMGARQDGRTPRQRLPRDPDADSEAK